MKRVWLKTAIFLLLILVAAWIALTSSTHTQFGYLARPHTFLHKTLTEVPIPQLTKPTDESELSAWLKQEGSFVGQIDLNPSETKTRLESKARSLRESDMNSLHKVIENGAQNTDQRFLAVYLLSLNQSQPALKHLSQISAMPLGPISNDRQYSDELIIRMQALEAVVKALPPIEAKEFLFQYLTSQTNPSLAQHARTLL